ncbi:hypothetical protein AX16_003673 [Volvariella volvacea WC 439]|nr:hypothetical protein AX16_003673 [Volvariella volvacea WC 439]
MRSIVDIPYSSDSSNPWLRFDIHLPSASDESYPLICFIHGGAWRSEDKAIHAQLALRLVAATGFPVAVPNYRLTPQTDADGPAFRHPGHAQDTLQFLGFISAWQGPAGLRPVYNPQRLYLIGHSCSAHMLSCIFLDSSNASPSLTPSPSLSQSVRAIIMSEGIYDLDLLLGRFPDYRDWFISRTFGPRSSYAEFSVTNYPLRTTSIRWFVIHSQGDTLVDLAQSEAMFKYLCSLHESIQGSVTANMTELKEEHNDILKSDAYTRIVTDFVLDDNNRC